MTYVSVTDTLQTLYRRLIDGVFYNDHDADLSLCGNLAETNALNKRLHLMRQEIMVERWSEDGERKSQRIARYKIDITTNYTEGMSVPGWMCSIRDWKTTGPGRDGFYAAIHDDMWIAIQMALGKMDEEQQRPFMASPIHWLNKVKPKGKWDAVTR